MKAKIFSVIIILLCSCLCSCGPKNTLTPLNPSQKNSKNADDEIAFDSIDTSSFEAESVYKMPSVGMLSFVNAPGMMLYTDQSHGATLSYINKKTGNAFYFCFDPTCTHSECPANILHLTNNMVYCNGKIYAVRPEPELGGAGTALYSVELDATGLKECYKGDGNEIHQLLAYENKLLFLQGKTDGGSTLISYDTSTGKNKIISEKFELDIQTYFTANNSIYYKFIGDTYLYRTDDFFETSEKLFDIEKISSMLYGDSTHIYGVEYRDDGSGNLESKAIVRCSLETGKIETLYDSSEYVIGLVGIDDNYCYFFDILRTATPYKRSDGAAIINASGGIVYRIPKEGGDCEKFIDNIAYDIFNIAKHDGKLYVTGNKYYQSGEVGRSSTFAGVLENGEIKEIVPR